MLASNREVATFLPVLFSPTWAFGLLFDHNQTTYPACAVNQNTIHALYATQHFSLWLMSCLIIYSSLFSPVLLIISSLTPISFLSPNRPLSPFTLEPYPSCLALMFALTSFFLLPLPLFICSSSLSSLKDVPVFRVTVTLSVTLLIFNPMTTGVSACRHGV